MKGPEKANLQKQKNKKTKKKKKKKTHPLKSLKENPMSNEGLHPKYIKNIYHLKVSITQLKNREKICTDISPKLYRRPR
jgi:hypothetical protein